MLTPGMIRALRLLLELPEGDQEIVCEKLECWIGLERVHPRTIKGLLWHMAITDSRMQGIGARIYIPTANSAAILKRPALADEMVARVYAKKPFYVDGNGVIRDA